MTAISDFLRVIDNKYATCADDGITAGDVAGWVDSGSYALNAILSGSIYKGFPQNKIVVIGADPSTGKTFFALGAAKNFLRDNPTGIVICFESESAITRQMLVDRGIDVKRFAVVPVTTVQEFRTQAIKIIDKHESMAPSERTPLFFILDSLGMLSTDKEIADTAAGSETKDMTRAGLLKATFRVLTLKAGRANVPMIVTNHVYDDVGGGPYAQKVQSGGCLVAGTSVIMSDGTLKDIQNIRAGDYVISHDGHPAEVTDTFTFNDKSVYEVSFQDGTSVKCSGDHRFMFADGYWLEARLLEEADMCKQVNGELCEVKDVRKVDTETVYDISVLNSNTYCLANGLICHNSGAVYASSTILTLSKAKDKDATTGEIKGVIITVTASKSRLTKENSKAKCLIRYDGGLDKYYGLLDLAEEAGIFKKVSTRYELEDGTKIFGSHIMKDPEKYFTKSVLDRIDAYAAEKYCYGSAEDVPPEEELGDEEINEEPQIVA